MPAHCLKKQNKDDPAYTKNWFIFTILFLIVDYGRPQDFLPIGFLRPSLLVLIILLFHIVTKGGLLLSKSNQTRTIWYVILLILLLVPFARNNYFAFQTFSSMLTYMIFIVSVIATVNSIERLRTFMLVYIGLMIYVAIYSLLHNGVGSGNYFMDENDVSLYINMVVPLCFFLFMIEKSQIKRFFYLAGIVAGLLAVIVSFSRGGFVGLVVMFLVVWLVSPKKTLVLCVIFILGSGAYLFSEDTYKQEMSTVTDTEDNTANERLMSWASGWDMFLDNPLGVGGGNFPYYFHDYQADRFKRGMWGRVAHSLWFTLLPELGVIGVFLYLRLLLYNAKDIRFLRKNSKSRDDPELQYINAISTAFIASLAGFFASASFVSVLYYPHYWYLTAIIVATVRVYNTLATQQER